MIVAFVFEGLGRTTLEAALALIPIVVFFLFFQIFFLRLPREQILRIGQGMILAFLGLTLFLQGVNVGFMPAGQEMGIRLGSMEHRWILIPIGFLLGFVVMYAEPAVRVHALEVEKVSAGSIKGKLILYALSLGVGGFVALGMMRLLLGLPLQYILLPGYGLVLVLLRFVSTDFVAIAFDSGGVATGPLTVTFVMAMVVGLATVMEGRDAIMDGFGLIALIALAPILSIMVVGLFFARKET